MVVVRFRTSFQLRSWYRRCYQGEHYLPSLGILRLTCAGNYYRTLREYPHMLLAYRMSCLTLLQSTLLYARYGNGIATNNLSKMLAGLMLPGRPIGNMYFAAWSHNVIANCVNLCNDLKMGEYRKCYFSSPSADVMLTYRYSQDPTACHVLHSNLRHNLGRFRQLRRHDLHCEWQPRSPD